MNGNMDPLNTARHVPHIKMIIQPSSTNVDDDDEIDWLVLTSHNLSIAAWGQLQKSSADGNIRIDDEKVLFIRSWELGVFISPATLMAGGHASAGNKLRMHPFRGISDSSPDAIINVDSDDDDDDGGNECKKSNVVLVPIPFDLNPDPYNNDDVAWARDRSCLIPDAFGCIMR
jgi:tyrosyl-DNA phosphodiesterase-1